MFKIRPFQIALNTFNITECFQRIRSVEHFREASKEKRRNMATDEYFLDDGLFSSFF